MVFFLSRFKTVPQTTTNTFYSVVVTNCECSVSIYPLRIKKYYRYFTSRRDCLGQISSKCGQARTEDFLGMDMVLGKTTFENFILPLLFVSFFQG